MGGVTSIADCVGSDLSWSFTLLDLVAAPVESTVENHGATVSFLAHASHWNVIQVRTSCRRLSASVFGIHGKTSPSLELCTVSHRGSPLATE